MPFLGALVEKLFFFEERAVAVVVEGKMEGRCGECLDDHVGNLRHEDDRLMTDGAILSGIFGGREGACWSKRWPSVHFFEWKC